MIPRQWLVPCHHRRASVEAHGSSSTHAKAQSALRVLQFRKIRPADGDSLLPPVRRRFSLAGEHPVRADVSVSPSSPPLSPSTAQPRHRGQTPMSPHDPIEPHPPRTTADCIGQPPPKGPSALSPEVTLRSIDGVGLSTSHGDDRSKQVTTGDDRKQSGNPRLIHLAMI